ncbi:MAG TPA: hypothetical protein DCZ75_08180 [Geobacter sp.]|nr:hypothetical protein [Geobacter sp.]
MRALRMLVPALFLALLVSPSASYAEPGEATMLEQARFNYEKGSYYIAATWLERTLTSYPRTPQREELLLMIAKCYATTWREDKAAQTVRTLQKYYPNAAATLEPALLKLVESDPYGAAETPGPELWAPPPKVQKAPTPAPPQAADAAPAQGGKGAAPPVATAAAQPAQATKPAVMYIPSGRARIRETVGLGPVGMDAALQARAAKVPAAVSLPPASMSGAGRPAAAAPADSTAAVKKDAAVSP